MTETRTPAEPDATRRRQLHRRVKRGIVASYIHELSERHNDAREEAAPAPEQALEPELVEQAQGD